MLTSKDICKETGLNKTQVSRLVDYGAIVPAVPADGRGKVRRFDDVNLAEFLIAKEFYLVSLDVQAVAPALKYLRGKVLYSRTGEPDLSFWEYVQSAEYRKRRRELGQEPMWLVAADNYTMWAVYRSLKEMWDGFKNLRGLVAIDLGPIVTRVFFPSAVAAPEPKVRPRKNKKIGDINAVTRRQDSRDR